MREGVPHILAKLLDDEKVVAVQVVHQEGEVASQLEPHRLGRVLGGHNEWHICVSDALD